ncbi:16S rRNA (cytosine967-C5)-methyltransferase [Formivibrio citricus]|uniref:16S rRNA (cytosine(967)-C(5))-methyltransferase n=1 Tax=Formivibrio citricus TaxID=83765 RepID=A0A1I4Y085_9NEIS|nr:16S rRNA (cytosine(967)-C(5))-methyltransferase RsmB [Formivibrio citricus]SFN30890.1 16S rRNA (cytosine967-C5)-methyltransferase [Formivibrio citricus]
MFMTQKLANLGVNQVLAGKNLNDALDLIWRNNPNLSPQQRGAIQDISYGTLRHLGLLNQVLEQLLRAPLHEPELRTLLQVALFQLQFSRAAPYAIVDHAVKVSLHTGTGKAKGLVNGVLRNFLRNKEELIQAAQRTRNGRYSHPEWWIDAMQKAWPSQWESILTCNNQRPPMALRINRRKIGVTDYRALLSEEGIAATPRDENTLLLDHPVAVERLPRFFDGWASVQDPGAQLAARLLDLCDGQRVLDACAAPGGKTGHILELANVDLTALDADSERLSRVRQNLDRLGFDARLIVGDAAQPADWWDGRPFDRILADVPCSASGVVRRHPDIKWLRRPADFANFARQQARIMDALWPLLAKGGKLLYATCSVFPAENAEQAAAFAARHPDAERLGLPESAPANGQLLPTQEHDGFYYALFRKVD